MNNNKCIINCANYGYKSATFFANTNTSKLIINSFGNSTLNSAKIYCPINGNSNECIITLSPTFSLDYIIKNAKIYAMNGFNDFQLYCYQIIVIPIINQVVICNWFQVTVIGNVKIMKLLCVMLRIQIMDIMSVIFYVMK